MVWLEIDKEQPLRVGDKIRLHYKTVGLTYVTATQIALVEKKLEKESRFVVENHSMPEGDGFMQSFFFEVRVVDQPSRPGRPGQVQEASIISAAVISAIILGAMSFFVWISFTGATKLVKASAEAAEGIEAVGWTSVQIAAALIAVYLVYKFA